MNSDKIMVLMVKYTKVNKIMFKVGEEE